MKKLPIGIQDFSYLIENDYIYIDKTKILHELITLGKYYFLSRPRRFGKSLLVSTLAAIFSGKKELFTKLAIYSLPYDWKQHPVITISLSDIPYTTPEILENGIKYKLQKTAHNNTITLDEKRTSGEMLQELVTTLAQKNTVVLLIDEYDYPILQHINTVEIAEKMREVLKSFYAVIKGLDHYLQFVLLTGVSKFSKASIFSGLNNLHDISLNAKYNTLLGYTQTEIITYFDAYLTKIHTEQSYPIEQLHEDIKSWYDGYRFTYDNNAIDLYNPFSVLLFLSTGKFANYWFETGTPTFLIKLLKTKNYPMQDFENAKASESELGAFEIDTINLKVLLFQTGYITIKSYNQMTRNYILNYPNKECIDSLECIITSVTHITETRNISDFMHKKL